MTDELRVTLCVDAIEPEISGIGRYALELSRRLPAHRDISRVHYFARRRLIKDPSDLLRGQELRARAALGRRMTAWRATHALKSTIVHAPNYFLPDEAAVGIVTVHDLSVFRFPETHPPARIEEFERLFGDSLSRAAQVITDSETIRRELIDLFNVKPDKLVAVPLGVSQRFRPSKVEQQAPVLRRFGLRAEGYGLCVSAFEPRKKIAQLIAAWGRLPRSLRDSYPLVLAGGSGWMNEQLHEQIERAATEGWLVHVGHVPEADLPQLYAGARQFMYPSIYEGFGLPPVEAMASGVPVIVSRRSCLPEICGDAPRYVDPDDDSDFLTALEECLTNSAWRSQAIQRGLDRAAQFTWDRCMDDTVAVYRRANLC